MLNNKNNQLDQLQIKLDQTTTQIKQQDLNHHQQCKILKQDHENYLTNIKLDHNTQLKLLKNEFDTSYNLNHEHNLLINVLIKLMIYQLK